MYGVLCINQNGGMFSNKHGIICLPQRNYLKVRLHVFQICHNRHKFCCYLHIFARKYCVIIIDNDRIISILHYHKSSVCSSKQNSCLPIHWQEAVCPSVLFGGSISFFTMMYAVAGVRSPPGFPESVLRCPLKNFLVVPLGVWRGIFVWNKGSLSRQSQRVIFQI